MLPNEDPNDTDSRFHRKRRRRRKHQDQELDHPQISGGSSSLDETIHVLLRLRSLEVEMKKTKTAVDKGTTRRIQDLAQHLDQFVMSLESSVNEVRGNTTTRLEHETKSLEAEINHRLDKYNLDFEACTFKHSINRPLPATASLQGTEVTPPLTTTFFQGAHNFTINGGHFGQPADQNVQKECQRIFWILIFNTGVLFY